MTEVKQHIKSQITEIPHSPGIYKYLDKDGEIIYIGKARDLKKRVASYFNKQAYENRKTAILVSHVKQIEYTVVDTEIDALLLENNLIKEFQPRYNIQLKDDKSFPFIRISKDRFPKVYAMRNPVRDGSEYFGPYTSVRAMHTVLDLVKRLYPIRNCNLNLSKKNIESGKFKVCLEYQIGNCMGPCAGLQTEEDYNESIAQIRNILKGNLSEVEKHLKRLMMAKAEALLFEEAEVYRKKIQHLDKFQSRSTIVNKRIKNADVFSIATDGEQAFVNYLRVVNGMIISSDTLELKSRLNESKEELMESAIGEMRNKYFSNATEIILPFPLDLSGDNLQFTIPKAGDKKKLLDLSTKNVLAYKHEKRKQYEKLDPELKTNRILETMLKDLRLKTLPRHIECFDNSNLQGTNPVAACVVFKNTRPSKKDYRHFNIKTVSGPDDFASMREVVGRRYKRLIEENSTLPDLVIVDGGKGQLSSAVAALKDLHIYDKIPVIGIAKRLEEIYYPDDSVPLYIDKTSETLKVIQHMRDEAHRFGITHHRNKRSKSNLQSELVSIPGIGDKTTRQLLSHFRSLQKIKSATEHELAEVVGKSKARVIAEHLKHE